MEQLINDINIEISRLIEQKRQINKIENLEKSMEKKGELEREIHNKKTTLLEKLKYYFSVIDESDKQSLTDRKKQFLQSALESISEIIEQINDKFDINNIEKMREFLEEKMSESSEKKGKKVSEINRKWETYNKYYNKCAKTIKTTENEEIKEILDKIIIILKRNMEIVSNDYTIIKDENIQNYIEMIEDRKSDKVRNIKERIAKISKADIESSNEKLEIQNERNKRIYIDDAKKLIELIEKLDILIKNTQNENLQESIELQENTISEDDIVLQNEMEIQAYREFEEELELQDDMELQNGIEEEYMQFQKYINSKIEINLQDDMELQDDIKSQEDVKSQGNMESQNDIELREYSEMQEKLRPENDLELEQYLQIQEYCRLQDELKMQQDLEMPKESTQGKSIFSVVKEKVNGAIDKCKKFIKGKIEKYTLKKFATYSKEEIENNAERTLDVDIDGNIIDTSKDMANTSIKEEDSVVGNEKGEVCEKAGEDVKKMLSNIAEKYKKMMEEGIGTEGDQSSDLNPKGSSNLDINR